MTQDKWQELLPTLLGNVTGEFEERVKVATLQALGYMCDDVSPPPAKPPFACDITMKSADGYIYMPSIMLVEAPTTPPILLSRDCHFQQWEPEDMNESQSNQILTCIVDGMRADRPPAIRGAAARALINSLDFTRSNFETQQERDVIMQVCAQAGGGGGGGWARVGLVGTMPCVILACGLLCSAPWVVDPLLEVRWPGG